MTGALDIATLDACFGDAPDPIRVQDRDGRYLYTNASAEAWLDRQRARIWGRTEGELDLPSPPAFDALRRDVFDHGEPRTHETQSDSTSRWYEHRLSALRDRDGGVIGVTIVTRDVTQRRSSEESSARAELERARFHRLLLHAPALVAILRGPDHVYEFLNELFCETIPEARRLVGTSARRHRADLVEQHFLDLLDHVYQSGEAYEAVEVPMETRGPDGTGSAYYTFIYQPIRSADGTVEGIASFAFDVSESVLARKQVEETSRAKDDFLSTLSHELRTPLNAIVGWSHLLRTGALEDLPRLGAQSHRALEAIDRNAKSQKRLIDDLLDFARMVSGKLGVQVAPVDLVSVVTSAVDSIRPSVGAKNVVLTVSVQDRPVVAGDPDRLQQVVANVLANAVKFTGPRGNVTVLLRTDGAFAELVVEDDGLGIDPTFLPFVFERFRQADATTTRRHGGLGLGLAIARSIVEIHGGTIEAESAGLGRGTRLRVRLPMLDEVVGVVPAGTVAAPAAIAHGSPVLSTPAVATQHPASAERKRAPHTDRPRLVGLRVLVVDDEEDARALVGTVLGGTGALVRVAASAAEALEALHHEEFDVLVSDIGMPDLDGITLIHRVRALPAPICRIPAIAITAYARNEDRDRAVGAGYDAFLSKPIDVDALGALVARVVGRDLDVSA